MLILFCTLRKIKWCNDPRISSDCSQLLILNLLLKIGFSFRSAQNSLSRRICKPGICHLHGSVPSGKPGFTGSIHHRSVHIGAIYHSDTGESRLTLVKQDRESLLKLKSVRQFFQIQHLPVFCWNSFPEFLFCENKAAFLQIIQILNQEKHLFAYKLESGEIFTIRRKLQEKNRLWSLFRYFCRTEEHSFGSSVFQISGRKSADGGINDCERIWYSGMKLFSEWYPPNSSFIQ